MLQVAQHSFSYSIDPPSPTILAVKNRSCGFGGAQLKKYCPMLKENTTRYHGKSMTSSSKWCQNFNSYVGQGVTRAHTLESQVHTGTILHHFSTQSHPRTQTGVTCAHSHFPESPTHTDWSHVRTPPFSRDTRAHRLESQVRHSFESFFPPRVTCAHITWDKVGCGGVGWGGVGWGGDDDILLHLHTCSMRCAMDCFGTYFTHVQKALL